MLEIVLDTETTGLSVKDGHRIVEIGCLELENQIPTKRFFHCLLNPERKVSEDAFKIHGYSDEFLLKKKKFSEIAKDFLEFIDDKKLIIHNADFDLSHLNNELTIIGRGTIKKNRVIDTLELAREKFRIDYSKRQKHNALIDCELLSKVYINLIDQKEPTLDFSIQNDVGFLKKKDAKFTKYSKKIIQPTSEEIQLHDKFLKNELKKNFF